MTENKLSIIERKLNYESDGRIFDVKLSDNRQRLILTEACDQHFTVSLTQLEVVELIREFVNYYNLMTEPLANAYVKKVHEVISDELKKAAEEFEKRNLDGAAILAYWSELGHVEKTEL